MMVQIYIIFDNSFLLQDLNIQSDKHELLKRGLFFEKDILISALNILYLTEIAIVLETFMMGLLLL